jgi:hemoglobin/transferrin/lactoferrin receptor protein
VFVQDEMTLGNGRVTLIPGIRYDRYEMDPSLNQLLDVSAFGFEIATVDENNLSTNLGIIYDVTGGLALFAQYSEGFRPPNFEEANQAFVNRAFGYATVPNPDLRPETSKGLELGLKASRERSRFSVAVYQNRYSDFIETQLVGLQDDISLFQDTNIGRAEIRGVELTGLWMLSDRWQLHGALAYTHGDNEQDDVPLDSVDPLTSVLGARFAAPNDRWSIETLLTLVSDKDRVSSDDRVMADAYNVVDLVGHYRIGNKTTLRMGVYNLFDQTYARWANIQGFAAADADAIARAQAPGANLRMSLSVQF